MGSSITELEVTVRIPKPLKPKKPGPIAPKAAKKQAAGPAVVSLTEARDQLSELVRGAKRGRVTLLGASSGSAKSMFSPPGNFGPQEPTAIHEIAIDVLRKRLRTVREEIENSGAAYRVMVNGVETAVFCPTQAAWDSKISRSRDNMLPVLIARIESKIDAMAGKIDDLMEASGTSDLKMNKVLALSTEFFKKWREDNGLPGTPGG